MITINHNLHTALRGCYRLLDQYEDWLSDPDREDVRVWGEAVLLGELLCIDVADLQATVGEAQEIESHAVRLDFFIVYLKSHLVETE